MYVQRYVLCCELALSHACMLQGGRVRFIPEFMKPKTQRGSQLGLPWEWRVATPQAKPANSLKMSVTNVQMPVC